MSLLELFKFKKDDKITMIIDNKTQVTIEIGSGIRKRDIINIEDDLYEITDIQRENSNVTINVITVIPVKATDLSSC